MQPFGVWFPFFFGFGDFLGIPPGPPYQEGIHACDQVFSVPDLGKTSSHIWPGSDVPGRITLTDTPVGGKTIDRRGPVVNTP